MSPIIIATVIALATLLQSTLAAYNVQPLYQVSLMVEFQPGNPVQICNGAIIYEKLIITTANCVHHKFGSKGQLNRLDPSVLSVVAGSTNAFTDAMRMNVCRINIANDFDTNTLDNDLALLTLCESLPLGKREDMKWIMLDDSVHVNHSCLANFFSRNSQDAVANYYQTEELILSNNEICRNETDYPDARKDDICSIYVLPQQFDCAEADSFLAFNNDRGTGLVCKSYLVGLLSSVVTRPDPKNNCSDVVLSAMYTNLFPHLMWVYNIMANIETEYISTPYDASLKSLVINSTQNNDKEVLTTTIIPLSNETSSVNSKAPSNVTRLNVPPKNSTITDSTVTDSIVEYSTLTGSTVTSSTVTYSTLTSSSLTDSTSTGSTTTSTTLTKSAVKDSTLTSSTLTNSSANNSTLTNTILVNVSVADVTLTDKTIVNSTRWNHPNVTNTTAISPTTKSSVIVNSTAAAYPLTLNSTEVLTTIIIPLSNETSSVNSTAPSNVTRLNVPPKNSTITDSTVTDSIVEYSTLTGSTVTSSTVTYSTLTSSSLTESTSTGSTTTSTTLTESTVKDSTLTSSTLTNSSAKNSTLTNTTLVNVSVADVTLTDKTIVNSTAAAYPLTWNSTISNSTSTNSTTVAPPPTTSTLGRRPPTKPLHSTESYMNYPAPTIQRFLKNSAAAVSVRYSASTLLISFLSLRLIIYH